METDALIRCIMARYGRSVERFRTVQAGGPKMVWKVETGEGTLCLKRLRLPADRAAFSVSAQAHMAAQGGPVLPVLPAQDGRLWVEEEGQVFVLYPWMDGRPARFRLQADLEAAARALAAFHQASLGYEPPAGSRVSSKVGRWPHHYRSLRERLEQWKEAAAARPQHPFHKAYLAVADEAIDRARRAEEALERSAYADLSAAGTAASALCHQDYSEGNTLVSGDRVWVLDLDNVTFDLPARDLRKLLVKLMDGPAGWREPVARTVLETYQAVAPLAPEVLELLAIDLLFPHPIHDAAKNWFQNGKPEPPSRLLEVLPFERSKEAALAAWLARGGSD